MQSLLHSYALISAIYDQGQDYFDCFLPFVATLVASSQNPLALTEIRKQLLENYGLEIPVHPLRTVMRRGQKKNIFAPASTNDTYSITQSGRSYVEDLGESKDTERELQSLFKCARDYISGSASEPLSIGDAQQLIETFIRENVADFAAWLRFSTESGTPSLFQSHLTEIQQRFLDFCAEVERSDPEHYKTLRKLIYGSVVYVVFQAEAVPDPSQKLAHADVYIDTNFLVNLLGLDYPQFNEPARELFALMKALGAYRFHVFQATIEELVGLLRSYIVEERYYTSAVRVRGVHGSLKCNGWKPSDVNRFIIDLDAKLHDLGISEIRTGIDLDDSTNQWNNNRKALSKFKHNQGIRAQNHDIGIVEAVRRLRSEQTRRFEECRHFILTCDGGLTRYCLEYFGHTKAATIPEAIPDGLLANLLWIKRQAGSEAMSITSIIAMHSRGLLVDRRVWDRFYTIMSEMSASGELSEDDVSMMLFDRQLESTLAQIGGDEVKDVTKPLVMKSLAEARERQEKRDANARKEAMGEYERRLREQNATERRKFYIALHAERQKTDAVRQQQREELISRFDTIRKQINASSHRTAMVVGWIYALTFPLIVGIAVALLLPVVVDNWDWLEPYVWLLSSATAVALYVMSLGLKKYGSRSWVTETVQRKLVALKSSHWDQLEQEDVFQDVRDEPDESSTEAKEGERVPTRNNI